RLIYGTLIRATPNGDFVPDMASSWKVVNPTTLDLKIRKTTFTDGAPFDAAAVKAGLERNLKTQFTATFTPTFFNIDQIDVTGPQSLRIRMKTPSAGLLVDALTGPEALIVSPKAAQDPSIDLNKTPVGAGPFILDRN